MADTKISQQVEMFDNGPKPQREMPARKKARKKTNGYEPPNLGKAIRLPVPDFSDPDRPPVCLEVDFPIAPINALSNLEGNAGKPIYQMSKWWVRRRSSVFRSLLIAAYLGIKRNTVYKWISEKQMPAHRMGRLWKFRKEEVDEWVKSGGAAEPDSKNSASGKE